MSRSLSTRDRAFHPAIAIVGAVVGAVAGFGVYLSWAGAVLGLVIALGALGIAAVVLSLLGFPTAATAQSRATEVASNLPGPLTAVAGAAPGDDDEDLAIVESTDSEAELLSAGRFAEFHLSKAKRLLADGKFKEAAYQAGASLAHDTLAEAREVREAARAAMRS